MNSGKRPEQSPARGRPSRPVPPVPGEGEEVAAARLDQEELQALRVDAESGAETTGEWNSGLQTGAEVSPGGGGAAGEPGAKRAEQALNIPALQEAVERVRGVTRCRIVATAAGAIEQIHVLADLSRSPKQIVRDVEAVLAARFGVLIDHRKVSVAQLGDGEEAPPAPVARLAVWGVSMESEQGETRVRVRLRLGEEVFEGEAIGPSATSYRPRLTASACLEAVERYLEGNARLVLEALNFITVGARQVAVASVTLIVGDRPEALVGSVVVGDDPTDAGIRAALDAVNRKIGMLASRISGEGAGSW